MIARFLRWLAQIPPHVFWPSVILLSCVLELLQLWLASRS